MKVIGEVMGFTIEAEELLKSETGIQDTKILYRLWQLRGVFPNIKCQINYKNEENIKHAFFMEYWFAVPDQSFSCHVRRNGVLWWNGGRSERPYWFNVTVELPPWCPGFEVEKK